MFIRVHHCHENGSKPIPRPEPPNQPKHQPRQQPHMDPPIGGVVPRQNPDPQDTQDPDTESELSSSPL
jgi:hypothetical protein